MSLSSINATHVQYDKSKGLIALVFAYSSLIPIFLIVSFTTLVLFKRDFATILFLAGQLINEVFNIILKQHFKEFRYF